MYSMHRYWSKKSPDVVAAYIEHYTNPGDIVLDPMCGSGIFACEAIRLGRRAIAIDINPMATFITKMTLTPVNLSRLQWAFDDLKNACERIVSELFVTTCTNCGNRDAIVEFVVKNENRPVRIAYTCTCSNKRLFKDPDERDERIERSFENRKIPYWYPYNVHLPIIQKERFQFLHELFTRRNLIALSTILNAIEGLSDHGVREAMKFAFTAALDKCSLLKPQSPKTDFSRPSLSQGWVAVRFYAPKIWQEVNPWYAFEAAFKRVYKGKKESNDKLKHAIVSSSYQDLHEGKANVAVINGSADIILGTHIPEGTIDYVLTDPPFASHIQYLALSTFWGAWLKFDFDYDKEIVVNRYRGKTLEDYQHRLGEVLKSLRRVMKVNKPIHIFYQDAGGPYLHKMLKLMMDSCIFPEKVLHQSPPSSFGDAVRRVKKKEEYYSGSYIVRGKTVDKSISIINADERLLRERVTTVAKTGIEIMGGIMPMSVLLHSIYHVLSGEELLMFAQHSAESFLQESIKEFALIQGNSAQLKDSVGKTNTNYNMVERIQQAILDAKSLYVSNPGKEGKKNQVYQRVVQRFQKNGITEDYVRKLEKEISDSDIGKYRELRLTELLRLLGNLQGYSIGLSPDPPRIVIWEASDNVNVSFRVTSNGVQVEAYHATRGEFIFEVGVISDENLERALFTWCQNNPEKSVNFLERLNPMEKPSLFPESPKRLFLKVLRNMKLCPEHYLLTLQMPKNRNLKLQPGQFLHIICDPDGQSSLTDNGQKRGYVLTLRRPFSIHRINYKDFNRRLLALSTVIPYEIREVIERPVYSVDILYKVIGKGTKSLSRVSVGKYLDIIGPIGNGFSIDKIDAAAIIAGGIGVAPLVALAERLRYLGTKVFLYFGALREELLRPVVSRPDSAIDHGYSNGTPEFLKVIDDEFKEIGAELVRVSTNDGSLGETGFITDLLEKDIKSGYLLSRNLMIYACGPSAMVKSVSDISRKYKINCQVLLEERMACGIGACFSCTCHIRNKDGKPERKRVCVDGPVFSSEDIIWQV